MFLVLRIILPDTNITHLFMSSTHYSQQILIKLEFLGMSAKFQKVTISFIMSVCPHGAT